jgi:hypothetical protein
MKDDTKVYLNPVIREDEFGNLTTARERHSLNERVKQKSFSLRPLSTRQLTFGFLNAREFLDHLEEYQSLE